MLQGSAEVVLEPEPESVVLVMPVMPVVLVMLVVPVVSVVPVEVTVEVWVAEDDAMVSGSMPPALAQDITRMVATSGEKTALCMVMFQSRSSGGGRGRTVEVRWLDGVER